MKQIELLESELKLMLDNIERLKDYVNDPVNKEWKPYSCLVMGELKHRSVSLKQRLTLINKTSTSELFTTTIK